MTLTMGPTRFDQLDSLFVGYRLPLRDRLAEALITSSVDVQASIEEGWMMDYTYLSLSLSRHVNPVYAGWLICLFIVLPGAMISY